MKKIIPFFLIAALISLVFVYSCSDKVLNLNPSTSELFGTWQVEQVQMMTPPTTGTPGALMKTALVPFGLMNSINIGQAEANLGVAKFWDSYSISENKEFSKVMFTSVQNVFALSADGKSLFRSVSGGATWDPVFNIGVQLNDVSFRNDNEGYSIMNYKYINYSNNSGADWQLKYTSTDILRHVYSLNARSNYVTGEDISNMGFLLRTIDSGNTWQRFNIGQGSPEYIKMISESNGWVIMTSPDGLNTVIYKSNNGGADWYNVNAPMSGCFYSAYALDENNLWVVLYDCENFKYYFYKTNNGGVSFVQMPNNYIIQNVYFVDQNNGFAVGDNNLLLATTTGGYTWVPQTGNSDNKMLTGVGFYDRTTGVITGANGSVYKYTNITDTSAFSMSGNVTNPVLQGIIKTDNTPRYAIGTFAKSYPNILSFHINKYSGGLGDVTDGGGTFILNTRLSVTLNLSNSEKWQVVLKK